MQKPSFVTIIIPTYERPRQLATCLASLTHLDYPCDRFEVIVVDDGSEVSLKPVVRCFENQFDIKLISQPNAGPATARNTGTEHAKGEFLAFLDDDCAPAEDWLKETAKRLAMMPEVAIGGRTLNAMPHNGYSTTSQLLIDYLYTYYNANPSQARFFTANNLTVPAKHFREIKGFDPTFALAAAEDRDLCDRWQWYGYRMVYAPEVIVYHHHELTWRTFFEQHYHYGCGAFYYHQVRQKRHQEALKLEPLSFYLNLLRYPFSQGQRQPALWHTALLVVSQVANAAGYYRSRMSQWHPPPSHLLL